MKNILPIIILFNILVVFSANASKSFFNECVPIFIKKIKLGTNLSETVVKDRFSKLKVSSYNVLNLGYSPGRYVWSKEKQKKIWQNAKFLKPAEQVEGVAKTIMSENPDILVLQEVESLESIKIFNKMHLNNEYHIEYTYGHDTRGIQIAYLIKKDLPIDVGMDSYRHIRFNDPISQKNRNLFSRDLPVLYLWEKNATPGSEPTLAFIGVHLKSQRDRAGDARSAILRGQQANLLGNIYSDISEQLPNTKVLIGGDFNADIHSSPEFKDLLGNKLKDAFDVIGPRLPKQERVTHSFHPWEGPTKYSQLDGILLNENAQTSLREAYVYRYLDKNGERIPLPETKKARDLNPSDHFMISTILDLLN